MADELTFPTLGQRLGETDAQYQARIAAPAAPIALAAPADGEMQPFLDLKALRPVSYELMRRMAVTQLQKAHDYAGADADPLANFRESERLGIPAWIGCLLRMGDKWRRMCNFARLGKLAVKDETFEDTALDLAVYSMILVELFQEAGKS